MINIIDNPLKVSILLYIIIIVALLHYKPDIFYTKNTKVLKGFGTGHNKTPFTLWFVILVVAIIIYFLVCLLFNHF